MSSLVAVFRRFPKDLFRVNNGLQVQLREWSPKRRVFDIKVSDRWVKPLALDPLSYQAPNGASMRPNSPYQQQLVSRLFKGRDVIVYSIPAGTHLPEHLLLVHERSDHYSLQPAKAMRLQGNSVDSKTTPSLTATDLNEHITDFFWRNAAVYTREQWLQAYPSPTDFTHPRGPR
ncbi:Uncharacterized protein TCAP_06225 [Tolypocladium capitatum]|uniref:Tse2 ADP-ribosyltransferase toxin domain-containing protein n=1 Tax=Tolypocladium capitatum TaxID=45235 RepID=A0A2K3Q8E9_9HYPO|nr:Uncharacterized protein TCAP_06225 [Tolypocladium capitatum]